MNSLNYRYQEKTDYDAHVKADEVAAAGKWEAWAQPGFKAKAGEIATQAIVDIEIRDMDKEMDYDSAVAVHHQRTVDELGDQLRQSAVQDAEAQLQMDAFIEGNHN